jgi:hypothetical protein
MSPQIFFYENSGFEELDLYSGRLEPCNKFKKIQVLKGV